jgi:hypothetical protein
MRQEKTTIGHLRWPRSERVQIGVVVVVVRVKSRKQKPQQMSRRGSGGGRRASRESGIEGKWWMGTRLMFVLLGLNRLLKIGSVERS